MIPLLTDVLNFASGAMVALYTVLAGAVAYRRGSPWWPAWALGGLATGPIAAIAVFFLTGKKCPACRSTIHSAATKCPRCGTDAPVSAPT